MKTMPTFDLAIIGAGITGVGIAVAANQKGLKTVLLEANPQIASEASNNSLRIIHGGFRYLQKLDFVRTINSLLAQKELLLTYPDLITPLRCLMPLNPTGLKSKYPAKAGAIIYACLQKILGSPLLAPQVAVEVYAKVFLPFFEKRFAYGALIWHDAQMLNPRGLVEREIEKISDNLQVFTSTQIQQVVRIGNVFQVTATNGEQFIAKQVVNASAFGCKNITTQNINNINNQIFWGRTYNLIFKDSRCLKSAFAVASTEGRQYFVVPRENNQIALGTFTAKLETEISPLLISTDINSFNAVCPEFTFDIQDLLRVEQGVLPAKQEFNGDADFLNYDLILHDTGYFQVYTPKYTTYRRLGRKVIKQVLKNKR